MTKTNLIRKTNNVVVTPMGSWYSVVVNYVRYTVLIQTDDVSTIVVLDEDFNKIPYEEWEKFEKIMGSVDLVSGVYETVPVVVLYKDERISSIMSEEEFKEVSNDLLFYYTSIMRVEVPKTQWVEGMIDSQSITEYMVK